MEIAGPVAAAIAMADTPAPGPMDLIAGAIVGAAWLIDTLPEDVPYALNSNNQEGESCEVDGVPEEGVSRPPAGSKPINETPWSGDHGKIKGDVGARPDDDVRISPDEEVWAQNANGTWTNHGDVKAYVGSGKASGRRGKDRERNRSKNR